MGKSKKFILIALALVATSASIFAFVMHTTEDCPLSHQLNPIWQCKVMDEQGSSRLVLHYYRKTGDVKLAIHYGSEVIFWLENPFGSVKRFKDVSRRDIKLGPVVAGTGPLPVIIDGETHQLKVIDIYHGS